MQLKRLYIHNYKSFYDTTIELGKFNIVVGENNSGKSNLIDVLEFINIAMTKDIERAISDKGGYDNLKNYRTDEEKVIIRATFEKNDNSIIFMASNKMDSLNKIDVDNILQGKGEFTFSFSFSKQSIYFSLNLNMNIRGTTDNTEIESFINNKDKSMNHFETHAVHFILSNRKSLLNKNQTKQKLVICSSINRKLVKEYLHIVLNYINIKSDKDFKINEYDTHAYKTISTYYFNADMIKTSSHQDNITKLKKDGSNLGKNLVHLKQNSPNSFEIVSNSMITTVNEIDGIDVQKTFGNYLIGFEENNSIIGIDKVSNGTINLLATITALNQPQNKNILLAFEEPERHLHLKAVNYLLEAFRSNEKQILITTHSTEILKHANIEEIIFTYRDSDGDTQAIRADEIPDLEGKMERLGYERPLSLDELIGCNIVGKFE